MLDLAARSGTTDIVVTPHASTEFPFDDQRVRASFRDLCDKNHAAINLHLGCDFHLNYENLTDALRNPDKYTINQGRYLMVELSDFGATSNMWRGLKQLIDARITPIITHPERILAFQSNLRDLQQWVRDGCFVQVTGQSFLGRFGPAAKLAAKRFMKSGLVHFVASDAHDCSDRTPNLAPAYKYVASRFGELRANAIFNENPSAVLWGDSIRPKANFGVVSRFLALWK